MQGDHNLIYWANRLCIPDTSDKQAFIERFRRKVESDVQLLGWNTLGCHSPQVYYPRSFLPYVCSVRFVDICHYMTPKEEDFLDVFSDEFVTHCDRRARDIVAPRAGDPFLLGYSMTDCPIWTDTDAAPHGNNVYGRERIGLPTWPRILRNLGPNSPGKAAYVETMRVLYGDGIEAFNRCYGTAFESFGGLLGTTSWRLETDPNNQGEKRDNHAFLTKVVDKCYEVETTAIRTYDGNHMILGDKLNGNTDLADSQILTAAKHSDLIFYQYYAFWEDQEALLDRFAQLTDKAIFHGDSCCSVPQEHLPDPYGPHCSDEAERVERAQEMLQNAFARPDFVGWNWCGWMDFWEQQEPGKQHSGVQDAFGNFYPIQNAMAEFSTRLYDVASGTTGRE
jgi:hypothetical protein